MDYIFSNEMRKLRKKTWIPITQNSDGGILDSKFGGTPYLPYDENWPTCKSCGEKMKFFFQININSIPEQLKNEWDINDGILQMFYCTNDKDHKDDFNNEFGNNILIRIIDTNKRPYSNLELVDQFSPKTIVGWKEYFDYPNFDEMSELGIKPCIDINAQIPPELLEECGLDDYTPEDIHNGNLSEDDQYDFVWEILYEKLQMPLDGEKLGGWPHWVQNVEYPKCPLCREKMRFLFQIDSNKSLPYIFGDFGCGHISQCSKHKHILAFTYESC